METRAQRAEQTMAVMAVRSYYYHDYVTANDRRVPSSAQCTVIVSVDQNGRYCKTLAVAIGPGHIVSLSLSDAHLLSQSVAFSLLWWHSKLIVIGHHPNDGHWPRHCHCCLGTDNKSWPLCCCLCVRRMNESHFCPNRFCLMLNRNESLAAISMVITLW